MLYNKRWDKPEVKADPFSLESFVAWAERQQADESYCFTNFGGCLFAKWFKSINENSRHVAGYRYQVGGYEKNFEQMGMRDIALLEPHTFGAALDRARKALSERQT